MKRGSNRYGHQVLRCVAKCRRIKVKPHNKPECPRCARPMRQRRLKFSCRYCRAEPRPTVTPGRCPYCSGRTWKNGIRNGLQRYACTRCPRRCSSPQVEPPPPITPEVRQARAEQAASLGDELLPTVQAIVQQKLPPDMCEDVQQELIVAALEGEIDLSNITAQLPTYRRRINRLSSHTRRFISIDATVPGTNHLTYADTLIG
jgi:hypothetical protein